MFNKSVYHQLNALIGHLETKKDLLDQDLLNEEQVNELGASVEAAWQAVCRRSESRRGPYQRRELRAA